MSRRSILDRLMGSPDITSNTYDVESYDVESACERIPLPPSTPVPVRRAYGAGIYNEEFVQSMGIRRILLNAFPVPESFSWVDAHPEWMSPIEDQEECGSCWAFASSEVLSDRFRIWTEGKVLQRPLSLSTQCLLSCSDGCFRNPVLDEIQKDSSHSFCNEQCGGGSAILAFQYIKENGLPTNFDQPYERDNAYKSKHGGIACARGCSSKDICIYRCKDIYMVSLYHTRMMDTSGHVVFRRMCETNRRINMENIMREIYLRGPVTAAINMFSDFEDKRFTRHPREGYFQPTSEVYIPPEGALPIGSWKGKNKKGMSVQYEGDHIISIVGWGDGLQGPYWVIRNTWGPLWGRNGYFYLQRGVNACNVEADVVAASPDITPFSAM